MSYFDRQIQMHKIFSKTIQLEYPTKANAVQWIDRILCDLSPENLSCDGELRGSAVVAKRRELNAALKHCQGLLGLTDSNRFADQFSVMPDEGAKDGFMVRALYTNAKRKCTKLRESALNTAVQSGFETGARILMSNGIRGVIVKINRTRVKVKGDDGRMWSVPPRCMSLLKVR